MREPGPDFESLIRRAIEIIETARPLPLSSAVKLDSKDEVLDLLEDACDRLPEELRRARWMLREREEFLAKTTRDAAEIVEAARHEAERMVQRTEIAREAQHMARKIVEDARDEARSLRLEAEDFCDQRLATFESVLQRTLKTVVAGRQKLAPPGSSEESLDVRDADESTRPVVEIAGIQPSRDISGGTDGFFDQDVLS